MKPRDDDLRVWAVVAATVRPLPGRSAPRPRAAKLAAPWPPAPVHRPAAASPSRRPGQGAPQVIEPGRYRRMALGREPIGGRIDLHGMGQDEARAALTAFITGAVERGHRGVLVITGKGMLGDGVLRRRVPEWLAAAPLRALVAGLSEAHRRHGGGGALYVALKRTK